MKCLRCSREISDDFFACREQSPEFKGGRFACPHCLAEHLRREVGKLPSGEPLLGFRLWGHLAATRQSPIPEKPQASERRKLPRLKRWR
jgi:hypothetical protein